MKVLKFGGTSVGTAESLSNVRQIVESLEEPAVVVVSALGGLTDKLIATARKAAAKDDSYSDDVTAIRKRHEDIVRDVIVAEKQADCLAKISPLLDQLEKLYDGVRLIADLPEKTLDAIVSFGERMSSVIVTDMVADASHVDSLQVVKTEKWFGKNIADTALTTENIKKTFNPVKGQPTIAGGFISTDRDSGEVTNLGRGGSDFTAALIAAALDAEVLEIWTDVDGFMTSDPRIISDAKIIPIMSFVESMELCSFGAKVIYPPTIYPVFHKNIPIKILNTFNPTAPGTLIRDFEKENLSTQGKIRGLSALKSMAVVSMEGPFVSNVAAINSRTFNALAKNGVSVYLVSPTEEADSFSFALKADDIPSALALIKAEFAPEINDGSITGIQTRTGLSIVAVVGEDILSEGRISPRVVNSLQRGGISPVAVSEGSSRTTVAFAVPDDKADQTLRIIHSLFFRNGD